MSADQKFKLAALALVFAVMLGALTIACAAIVGVERAKHCTVQP